MSYIVRSPVFTFTEFVVAAAILVAMSPDSRWDGGGVAQVIVIAVGRIRVVKAIILGQMSEMVVRRPFGFCHAQVG
jgi:hypothetical protein